MELHFSPRAKIWPRSGRGEGAEFVIFCNNSLLHSRKRQFSAARPLVSDFNHNLNIQQNSDTKAKKMLMLEGVGCDRHIC